LYISKIEWDSDPELFAFENCIMNLTTGQFVEPRKEQYIKTTCGWKWDHTYDNLRVETIQSLVCSILPIEAVRDYYLTYESTGLSGNKVQRVLINTGTGGNGKSLLRELKNKAVGGYGMKIPTEVLCNDIKAGGANPVIANMDGKRSIYFSEPNAKQKICTATLKEITGDSHIVGRKLYSGETDVKIIATLSGDCNEVPLFDGLTKDGSDSVLRRLSIAPFITRAVTREEYDTAEDKTYLNIRQNFAENDGWMNENKQAYFIILQQAYTRYKAIPNVLDNLPGECKDRAVAQLNASCDIMSWLEAEMQLVENVDTSDAIPLKTLYTHFKENDRFRTFTKPEQRKYSQNYFIGLLENSKTLQKFIKNRDTRHNGVKLNSKCLIGYQFINYEADEATAKED
jgi:hypothetical protein